MRYLQHNVISIYLQCACATWMRAVHWSAATGFTGLQPYFTFLRRILFVHAAMDFRCVAMIGICFLHVGKTVTIKLNDIKF